MSKFYNIEGQSVVVEAAMDEIALEGFIASAKEKIQAAINAFMKFIGWLSGLIKEAAAKAKELIGISKMVELELYDTYESASTPLNKILAAAVKRENDYQKIAFKTDADLNPLCEDLIKDVIEPLDDIKEKGPKKYKVDIKELSKKLDNMHKFVSNMQDVVKGYKMAQKIFENGNTGRPGEVKLITLKISYCNTVIHIFTTDANTITKAMVS